MKNNSNNNFIPYAILAFITIFYSVLFAGIVIYNNKSKKIGLEYLNRNNEIHIYKQDSIIIYKFKDLEN